MVNEDILTSLKNAVARGESLDSAIQTATNSGYNSREVEEASRYIGAGVVNLEKASQERMLAMPNQKNRFSFFSRKAPVRQIPQIVSIKPMMVGESSSTNRSQTPQNELAYSSIPIPQQKSTQLQMPSPQIQIEKPQPIRIQQILQPAPPQMQQQIKENISPPRQISPALISPQVVPQNYTMNPMKRTAPKQTYTKEIILLIMLLVLAGILIITFRYRDQIIAFFSG